MAIRPRRQPHLTERQRKWYDRTPKWRLMILAKHLAARTDPDSYDAAIDSGGWFALLRNEEALLKRHRCFDADSTRW